MKLTDTRIITAGIAIGVTTLTSCSLPPGVSWNDVRSRGLVTALMDYQPGPAEVSTPAGPQDPVRVQEVVRPQIATAPYATPVPSRPGYVYSPHAKGNRVVDVRDFSPGEEVRCPFTMQAFLVPNLTQNIARQQPANPKPVAQMVSTAPSTLSELSIPASPEMTPSQPKPEKKEKKDTAREEPKPRPEPKKEVAPAEIPADLPFGSRVTGRPGFVYSPYAEKNQLVDVAGIAPGVEVKCPYTGRLFRVPEPLPEESAAPAPQPTPPANNPAKPEAAPQTPAPAPTPSPAPDAAPKTEAAPATPAEEPLPTAKWAQRDKALVQSPFGSPGQIVDVSGKGAGARVVCPFTGKPFLVPAD